MLLGDFIERFAKNYSVVHIDDFEQGTLYKQLKKDIYLVKNGEVKTE